MAAERGNPHTRKLAAVRRQSMVIYLAVAEHSGQYYDARIDGVNRSRVFPHHSAVLMPAITSSERSISSVG
jgi:hypothetical protein